MTHLSTRGANMDGLRWLDAIRQDARFGVRMLVKYRGMTLVGAFAMAVAIAVGATTFAAISAILDPALPFPGGGRVVALNFVDPASGLPERQVIHQFAALRGQLVTVEHFGAFRDAEHNLVASETAPEPVTVAEITASAFALAGTPASLGRYLLPTDESESAPPVVVIGYDAWQLRFGADPKVVGRSIGLGGVSRTIVGVMPREFKFPYRSPVLGSPARESAEVRARGRAAALPVRPPGIRRLVRSRLRRSSPPLDAGQQTRAPSVAASFGLWSFRSRAGSSTRR